MRLPVKRRFKSSSTFSNLISERKFTFDRQSSTTMSDGMEKRELRSTISQSQSTHTGVCFRKIQRMKHSRTLQVCVQRVSVQLFWNSCLSVTQQIDLRVNHRTRGSCGRERKNRSTSTNPKLPKLCSQSWSQGWGWGESHG